MGGNYEVTYWSCRSPVAQRVTVCKSWHLLLENWMVLVILRGNEWTNYCRISHCRKTGEKESRFHVRFYEMENVDEATVSRLQLKNIVMFNNRRAYLEAYAWARMYVARKGEYVILAAELSVLSLKCSRKKGSLKPIFRHLNPPSFASDEKTKPQ